ncbi:MAG TPA: septum formation initiator family protein [Candidatus Avoscillospira stercorigallinarum]|uniref:Septum formation initiator family protein n=1 Tax=Candidatus Avoscillospira stercorigallinarum TaxID=2840708 RepID=A0A9D1CP54_9FIRM|nr:septum formation initiator family protein [Candidatus Avoscillospira stercorigallinarum]
MRFKRSSLVTKVLILVLVVYATVTLVSLQSQVTEKETQAAALQDDITAAQQENLRLEQAINALGTDEGVEAVARQKLGLVAPGEILFYDVGN